jgi:polyhydroxybutyrate depolymerase
VVGYTIVNGGHTWPDGTQYLPKMIVGKVSHNLDACKVIWEFFKNNRLAVN